MCQGGEGHVDLVDYPEFLATCPCLIGCQVGFDYPEVPRREKLPEPAEVEKPVPLWSMIKDCVGKDVSRITLPVDSNEPISTAQKTCEEMEYSWLLDRCGRVRATGMFCPFIRGAVPVPC